MVVTHSLIASLLPLFLASFAAATPVQEMTKRYDQDTVRYMQDYGCFRDDINDRLFSPGPFSARPKKDLPQNTMTIKTCYEGCLTENWEIAGLQNGRLCMSFRYHRIG